MKIASLQFNPTLGAVQDNILRADRILDASNPESLDLLILPELAFSGYNFGSLAEIKPFLEPTAAGVSTTWALKTAARLNCVVVVGYPEVAVGGADADADADVVAKPDGGEGDSTGLQPRNYNSTVTVAPDGTVLAHYRKSFLYYTDQPWASEGSGFYAGELPIPYVVSSDNVERQGAGNSIKVAHGICMDINPYKFTAEWSAFEFATHAVEANAALVLVSMAWSSHELTPEDVDGEGPMAHQPDIPTLSYWINRLGPIWERRSQDVVVVMANRCGVEGSTCYAGTSTVMGMNASDAAAISLWGILGKGEERCLVVDTSSSPKFEIKTAQRQDMSQT